MTSRESRRKRNKQSNHDWVGGFIFLGTCLSFVAVFSAIVGVQISIATILIAINFGLLYVAVSPGLNE